MSDETIIEEVALTDADCEDYALRFTPLAQFGKATPVQNGANTDTDDVEVIAGSFLNIVIDATTTTPYARGGVAHIPAGIVAGVTQQLADSSLGRTGIVSSVQSGSSWSITQGVIQVGLADSINGPGVIGGAEYKKLQGKSPTLVHGTLNLPLAQAGAGAEGTTEDTPGGLVGIGYSADGCFGIVDGFARIPRPPELPSGIDKFPVGVYHAVALKKITWEEMGTGVVPMTNPPNPKDGDLRIAAFLLSGGYLSLMMQKYNKEEGIWE